jgi:NTE family protein
MPDNRKPVDLVLEGGGVKGIGLLGAVLTLYDAGYRFERVAGTSAGAIVAALVAAYQRAERDLHELEDVMRGVDYGRFADGPLLERLTGRIGEGIEVLLHDGAHSGSYLTDWLGPLLEDVGVRTFADLRLSDPDSSLAEYQCYALVVHASDLTRRVLVRLPWDYDQYGQVADEQLVVDAVRASMSIPFYFRPVQVDTGRGTATWVDGGLLSNFPITVFDRTDGAPERWPTWGVKLSGEPRDERDRPVGSALSMVVCCLQTLLSDWNRYRLDEEGVNRRTIHVNTDGVSATDFGIAAKTREALFRNGQRAARRFLVQRSAGRSTQVTPAGEQSNRDGEGGRGREAIPEAHPTGLAENMGAVDAELTDEQDKRLTGSA